MEHTGLTWRKSTHSGTDGSGDCVEIACLPLATVVRDSKNPRNGILTIPAGSWSTFLADLR